MSQEKLSSHEIKWSKEAVVNQTDPVTLLENWNNPMARLIHWIYPCRLTETIQRIPDEECKLNFKAHRKSVKNADFWPWQL